MPRHNPLEEMIVGLYDRGMGGDPADKIFDIGVSKKLKSGIWSPYLVNVRPALSIDHQNVMPIDKQVHIKSLMLSAMCMELGRVASKRPFQHIYGEPEAGTPFAAAIAAYGEYSQLWKRVIAKPGYGSHQLLEGVHHPGELVTQIDDVVTLGTTKREADIFLRECNLISNDVVVFVDREQGGRAAVEEMGLHLSAAVGALTLFAALEANQRITPTEADFLRDYTLNPPTTVEPTDHPWKQAS